MILFQRRNILLTVDRFRVLLFRTGVVALIGCVILTETFPYAGDVRLTLPVLETPSASGLVYYDPRVYKKVYPAGSRLYQVNVNTYYTDILFFLNIQIKKTEIRVYDNRLGGPPADEVSRRVLKGSSVLYSSVRGTALGDSYAIDKVFAWGFARLVLVSVASISGFGGLIGSMANARRMRRLRAFSCPECGYSLVGLVIGNSPKETGGAVAVLCPECGTQAICRRP